MLVSSTSHGSSTPAAPQTQRSAADMTTAPLTTAPPPRPVRISPELRLAGAFTTGLAAVATPLAALVSGSPAALGASIGCVMVLVFFGVGAVTMDVVATVSPAASLLVALLTYTLQVLAVGIVFVALDASDALGATVHAGWLSGAVIVATFVWLAAQTFAATRTRQPLYDLPTRTSDASEASAQ
jgi:ATP synthase protein I